MRMFVPAFALALPMAAAADPPLVIQRMLTEGATIDANGQTYGFIAGEDGAYSDASGAKRGRYRIDGEMLCLTPLRYPVETCLAAEPDDKGDTDEFTLASERGPMHVTLGLKR